ncbi:class I SAM-dependent methyltransferase [Paenibacillus sp. M1]|uniref:Class I SAM-dependent methyltransferase n=1 Tax=Paenibacillus haidiansis TaxID=1574488 RepID=A0ABU7VSU0_9BACL
MNLKELRDYWKSEEEKGFQGWDFSYISGRMKEQELPWDYAQYVKELMAANRSAVMLDMGTGGGEFLLSLAPPPGRTFATEAYLPNYELCRAKLPPYGIEVKLVEHDDDLPFGDEFFDLVINRHESFSTQEVYRILKPGGVFVTQQVGGMNNRELSRFLLGDAGMETDAGFNLSQTAAELEQAGFTVLEQEEFFPEQRFFDMGALVYFAKILEWEFSGFSVDRCFERLCKLQEKVERTGFITSTEHRFFILARKSLTS